MDEVFADFRDVDQSFVREFQTGGFSARVFELALFAYLSEQEYALDRTSIGPDFIIREPVPFAIEATTANPPQDEGLASLDPDETFLNLVPKDLRLAEREFVFQVGKALRRKLTKRDAGGRPYWEQPHVAGRPFVIALQVFYSISSLFHPVGLIANYLYGRRDVATHDADGRLQLTVEPIGEHEYQGKSIPSGLFSLPEASHLSGVLFSNSQTAVKFNRIATERGYGPPDITMIRMGTVLDRSPEAVEPELFGYVVVPETEYFETFSEGLHLIHNPWARNPLPVGALRDVTEHRMLEDGRVEITASRLDPFMSQTDIFGGPGARAVALTVLEMFLRSEVDHEQENWPRQAPGVR
jgi:hypothetical protein